MVVRRSSNPTYWADPRNAHPHLGSYTIPRSVTIPMWYLKRDEGADEVFDGVLIMGTFLVFPDGKLSERFIDKYTYLHMYSMIGV